MTLGTGILGEVILGDGDSVSGTPTPTPTPTSTSKYISIIDTGVKIQSGNTSTVIDFIAVDADGALLTDLTGFSVARKRGSGTATAMTSPTVTQINKTLMPGWYSLLCDEDTTISAGIDSENMVFQITQATMQTTPLRVEIVRPKITPGETLTVNDSGVITLPVITDDWLTPEGIAEGIFPQYFSSLDIELTQGGVTLSENALNDLVMIMDSNSRLSEILGRIVAASNESGNFTADLVEVNGDADTLNRFAQAVNGNTLCVVGTGSTLTTIVTSSCDPVGVVGNPDQFAGKAGTFPKDTITPELRGKSFRITASTGAVNPTLTVTGLTIAPADGDRFNIL